jgi:site-specific recombinase XerD
MTRPARTRPSHSDLEQILEARIQTLATTLRRGTVANYRSLSRRFLSYLHANFPRLRRLSQLRRDPHMLGWFRFLCEQDLSNITRHKYLLDLRHLLLDFGHHGHSVQQRLILPEDFPPLPRYLPRPLSPEDDQLLQQELRRTDDLYSNALLLMRATGIRIGECIHLALDCIRPLGQDQLALHVPLGKLYTERLVPIDEGVRQIVNRILVLRGPRAQAPANRSAKSAGWLLPRSGGFYVLHGTLRAELTEAAKRAGCSRRVTPHQLRHTYATEMLRLGVSLPALMQLLGHNDIRMTLRYLQVTQQDLQREFHLARPSAAQRHVIPKLAPPASASPPSADLPGVRAALAAARYLLEMYRRQLEDQKARRKLQRLDKRLLNVVFEIGRLATGDK